MGLFEHLPLTPFALYQYAKKHGLEHERLRICDGMAVSYFPTEESICRAKNKIVIDVSCEEPVEYDDLADDDRVIVYRLSPDVELHFPPQPLTNAE
ncbi:MAG: hypothetical protein IKU22_11680 [Alistipes sp.]|nr:hypothetical protein [Alistipes sp.]